MGEVGLIQRISAILGDSAAVVGIGDDAAVIDQGGEDYLLVTVDMLVEDVHFRRWSSPDSIGHRAVAVNVSDIAAMGGTPDYCLTSIAVPSGLEMAFLAGVYGGIREEAAHFGVSVVGGNVSRTSGPLVLDLTLLGRVPRDEVILRRGAQPGDLMVATGVLGEAAARVTAQERGLENIQDRIPEPRVSTARVLAREHLVHAMMDLSDGLGSDLHHLAAASGVGAVIQREALPVSIEARRLAAQMNIDPLTFALYGGEDYELLMAMPPENLERARQAAGEVPLAVVGTILHPDQGVLLELPGGRREPLPPGGWTHF